MRLEVKSKILSYFKKNSVKRFSLFFTVTFIALIFFKLSNNYKHTIYLEVKIENLQDEILIKEDSLNVLTAYVEAKGFSFLPFFFGNTKAIKLNTEQYIISKSNHYIFDVPKHQFLIEEELGSSYKIISIKPDTLLFFYSKRASKVVPVVLNSTVNYTLGFDKKDKFNLKPDSVKIVGSESEIHKINHVNTEVLKLNNVNKNIKELIKVNLSNYTTINAFPQYIEVDAEVTRFTEGKIEVPIHIKNIPSEVRLNYFPKTVALYYYVDLENYKLIKPSDFVIECNYNSSKGLTYMIPKLITKPDFVKRAYIKQKRVDYIKL